MSDSGKHLHTHHESCSCREHEHHEGCGCHEHEHREGCGCREHEHHEGCGCREHENHEGCSCHTHDHASGCSCGHDHGNDEEAKRGLPRLAAAFALFALGLLLPAPAVVKTALLLLCYLISGGDVLRFAVRSLTRGRMMDENFLMALASVAAILIGETVEGCAVMLFYQVGETFQSMAVGRSRKRIKALLALKPDEAFVRRGEGFERVNPKDVQVGEEIRVRPGERVPLDARVVSGVSEVDTSALTGESVLRTVQPGDAVLAGFVARSGVIAARVEKPLEQSSVSRILEMVEQAQERKAPAERFITVFARVYTPIVVALALALALLPPIVLGQWRVWMYRALTFLVASCPCALVISVPLCYFAGIGSAARRGILIKGGDSLDALCRVKTFVLDKTGTLTTGEFSVTHVHAQDAEEESAVLALIAAAESESNHPLAQAAVKAAKERALTLPEVTMEREIAGRGVQARAKEGEIVLCGNLALMEENGVCFEADICREDMARIYAARAGKAVGFICLEDRVKPGAAEAIGQLRRQGVERTVMLTGDREGPAQAAARETGVSEVHAQLLPQDKMAHLEALCAQGAAAFVGDGINDAPALTRADVGIAMGALGSDAAIEAADVVLMTDEMDRLPAMMDVARRVRSIARQNIAVALAIKIGVLALAAFGMAGMWAAVFADVGVALICVVNAMRAMR